MKTLVIVAHPNLTQSNANRILVDELKNHPEIDIHYLNWEINVKKEQELLEKYDRIVLQFPFYWYSVPAVLKKWFEEILTPGWAFGEGGNKLAGKEFISTITTGGSMEGYQAGAYNWHTISEYILPLQATITRCQGIFLPSFVIHGTRDLTKHELKEYAQQHIDYIKNYKYVPFPH
ncbi:glutathione-regulated potassium-efflux system ancillary protein KefG [Marininema mesophilum]|uniref:Glutathione-regulated potassium-efflux system ancillary protein KefG n=1 Tax=Marininema mesophilum TaxID=1048340 RepID=A0A1H3A4M5_9BACL|nr:NAD(P)H-dependent oxidoreductase [Marininema mesophilum]SDX24371.1 glutathione-regulated potassium-efflux system ancillary protein KefG [Marininema mesophilum]